MLCAATWLCAYALAGIAQAQTPGAYAIQSDALVPMSGAYTGLNCNDLSVAGTLLLGAGEIDQANDVDVPGILDAGSGMIRVGGNWSSPGMFLPGASTVVLDGSCSGGPVVIEGPVTFCKLDLGSGIEYHFPTGAPVQVECELDLGDGNTLTPSGPGPADIVLGPDADLVGEAELDRVRITRSGGSGVTPIPALSPIGLGLLSILIWLGAAVWQRMEGIRTTGCRRI
ncbi:hypothetical protein C0099_10545 [Pseudazoarcus pumilus]|uniref:IPTL-CTERM protein sorting domain-containing protein n=2 Tax=Pseudazoarcus pumilus TaxID=2067960 RepID=A0A2I6S7V7_9RHOO|nr:hypothetical protein C0099_10545 [Pseudazoarcus pumilus]